MNLPIEWKLYGILERAETKEVMYFFKAYVLRKSTIDLFFSSFIFCHTLKQIRDYEGSYSTSPMHQNAVTYNLNKCKSNVVIPYFKLLCLVSNVF